MAKSRILSHPKVSTELDMRAIVKERQRLKWAFGREWKAMKTVPVRKEVLPTFWHASIVVLNNDDDSY